MNAASQRYHTISVNDALKEVFSVSNTTQKSTVRDALAGVISAAEMSDNDSQAEEQPTE